MGKNWQSDSKTIEQLLGQIRAADYEVEVDAAGQRLRAAGKGITLSVPYLAGQEASHLAALAGKLGVTLKR